MISYSRSIHDRGWIQFIFGSFLNWTCYINSEKCDKALKSEVFCAISCWVKRGFKLELYLVEKWWSLFSFFLLDMEHLAHDETRNPYRIGGRNVSWIIRFEGKDSAPRWAKEINDFTLIHLGRLVHSPVCLFFFLATDVHVRAIYYTGL